MPFDMNQIVEAATAFKTALDGLKVLKGFRGVAGDKATEDKISEIQGVIFTAQQNALSAQASQLEMHHQITELKEKIASFETWDREKTRYSMKDVNPSYGPVIVYALRPEATNGEPFHVLCAKCFEHRKKSILQATRELKMRQRVHVCHECKSEYVYGHIEPPAAPGRAITDYDIFNP